MRGLALLFIAALLVSGCSSKSDDTGGSATGSHTGSGTGSKTGSGTGTGTTTGGGGAGTIAVTLNRTTIDGPAPLKVNFTLSASFKDASGKAAHPTSSITVTYRQTADANGTAVTQDAKNGPSISSLPNSFSLSFDTPGKFEVVATVKSKDYKDGQATVIILPRAVGPAPTPGVGAIFYDGGEGDASQWTLKSTVLFIDTIAGVAPTTDTGAPYEAGCTNTETTACKWMLTDKAAKTDTHSWASNYPDDYRGLMTSKTFTLSGAGTLSFAIKGGAEQNNFDGLHVLAGPPGSPTELALIEDTYADWATRSFAVTGSGDFAIVFQFDADSSCSSASGEPPGGVLTCGAGFDQGGYWLDDITVA